MLQMHQYKVDMQEEQIRQLEHHAAQLKESLKAGGLIGQSVAPPETGGLAVGGAGGGGDHGGRGADGDMP